MRHFLLVFGIFLLAIPVALVAAFGPASPRTVTLIALLAVAGALVIAAASRDEYRVAGAVVPWYTLLGTAYVLVGLTLIPDAVGTLAEGTWTAEAVGTVAGGLGGLALCAIGFDVARGGRHFDVSRLG